MRQRCTDLEISATKQWNSLKTVHIAGTGMCVHIPFRLNPVASLAWLGKQLPCPLLLYKKLVGKIRKTRVVSLETGVDTHTEPYRRN